MRALESPTPGQAARPTTCATVLQCCTYSNGVGTWVAPVHRGIGGGVPRSICGAAGRLVRSLGQRQHPPRRALRRFCDRNGGRLTVVELPLYAPISNHGRDVALPRLAADDLAHGRRCDAGSCSLVMVVRWGTGAVQQSSATGGSQSSRPLRSPNTAPRQVRHGMNGIRRSRRQGRGRGRGRRCRDVQHHSHLIVGRLGETDVLQARLRKQATLRVQP